MKTPIRRRQLRGLVLHHRRHPADHRRRLINRTASWGEPPRNGICRWCYELTASPSTRWHLYCLNAYRVASDQHPEEIQRTLCEICGDPPDEIDHRLSIQVARALGPAAMLLRLPWTTCAGCAGAATSARHGRTGVWRSSWPLVRSTGTAHDNCSGRTAVGRCRLCCRAAWSLLRAKAA